MNKGCLLTLVIAQLVFMMAVTSRSSLSCDGMKLCEYTTEESRYKQALATQQG